MRTATRITRIICEQQVNFVDVMTSDNNNLQISFVHSRYRNEDVAICVLVDVSARVKMEESLQEMAAAAEQASQSKSMFPGDGQPRAAHAAVRHYRQP
ncbi:Sensor kinase protein RcsC [Serratia rubidaea]|uniref:Sensor kinase protein RcsC n=1 Tax=Serratia rubidaea TaxID=61652 RepID=A0A4U9HLQ5_SERRU|nr:Sensor kinase protein RcsC [Serratia rubidaea]